MATDLPLSLNNGGNITDNAGCPNQDPIQTLGQANNSSAKNKKLFPQKLWDLINDDQYNFCLRWSDDGQLVYLNRDEFEDSYLKTAENQFHTQKAISFVRQMNMYGFRKVDDCYYENDNFKRDCEHLLKRMIRKHPNKTNNSSSQLANSQLIHDGDLTSTSSPIVQQENDIQVTNNNNQTSQFPKDLTINSLPTTTATSSPSSSSRYNKSSNQLNTASSVPSLEANNHHQNLNDVFYAILTSLNTNLQSQVNAAAAAQQHQIQGQQNSFDINNYPNLYQQLLAQQQQQQQQQDYHQLYHHHQKTYPASCTLPGNSNLLVASNMRRCDSEDISPNHSFARSTEAPISTRVTPASSIDSNEPLPANSSLLFKSINKSPIKKNASANIDNYLKSLALHNEQKLRESDQWTSDLDVSITSRSTGNRSADSIALSTSAKYQRENIKLNRAFKRSVDSILDCTDPISRSTNGSPHLYNKRAKLEPGSKQTPIAQASSVPQQDQQQQQFNNDKQQQNQISTYARNLVTQIASNKDIKLSANVLNEASRYTENFVGILFETAQVIARHSYNNSSSASSSSATATTLDYSGNNLDTLDLDGCSIINSSNNNNNGDDKSHPARKEDGNSDNVYKSDINQNDLNSALKLLPSKLSKILQ